MPRNIYAFVKSTFPINGRLPGLGSGGAAVCAAAGEARHEMRPRATRDGHAYFHATNFDIAPPNRDRPASLPAQVSDRSRPPTYGAGSASAPVSARISKMDATMRHQCLTLRTTIP